MNSVEVRRIDAEDRRELDKTVNSPDKIDDSTG
jgi:hypothetical protein